MVSTIEYRFVRFEKIFNIRSFVRRLGGKYFDRCNFACLELAGYMFLPCEIVVLSFFDELFLFRSDENVFNELTENELIEHLNSIALPVEHQQKIKNDVMKLIE